MENVFFILELIGITAFSISGAIAAMNKHLDIFGVLVCSVTTAMGGGILRDLFIDNLPPVMFQEYAYLITAAAVSAVTFIAARVRKNSFTDSVPMIDKVTNVVDAVGLGLFTIVGIDTAIRFGFEENAFFVIFLGAVTGCGGSIIRDIMLREIPLIFTKRIYAVASLAGGIVYYLLMVTLSLNAILAVIITLIFIFMLRILASVFRWDLPKAF